MKMKTLVRVSFILLIPTLFSSLMLGIISAEWFFNETGYFANLFLSGKFNRGFCVVLFGVGTLAMAFVATTFMMLSRHTDKLDNLQEAEFELHEARRKYIAATHKIVQEIQ